MAQPGNKAVHKSKRHNNPQTYKSGKPRLRGLNTRQLNALLEKTQVKKEQCKIERELRRKQNQALHKLAQFNQENNLTY
jgi:hypothetical protein